MKKMLFLIHDLGPGGAEKVLVNLVNNMDREKFDITVLSLFDEGVNRQFLAPHIRYRYIFKRMFRGNSHLMKLFTPKRLHRLFIKEAYDIEVSYLEGPCARIISGCPDPNTRLAAWIHCMPDRDSNVTLGFRSCREAQDSYKRFHQVVCVSQTAAEGFKQVFSTLDKPAVAYNVNDTDLLLRRSKDPAEELDPRDRIRIVTAGRLNPVKALDRLVRIHARLRQEGYPVHTYLLGEGAQRQALEDLVAQNAIADSFTFLGYQTNPCKYVAKCDLFVCSSLSEGFSTAATEALIVGTPVCTVEVSGMKEMLGENNEYGIVTENDEEALYRGIKGLLDDPALLAHYKTQAALRGETFSTAKTVTAVEDMLLAL